MRVDRIRAAGRVSHDSAARSTRTPTVLGDVVGILGMSVVVRLVYGAGNLGSDAAHGLTRGALLFRGEHPEYAPAMAGLPQQIAGTAPTPHPLSYVASGAASVLGKDAGYTVVVGLSFLAFGALLWGLFRLGAEVFSWPAGALAAVVVGSSYLVADRGAGGGVDVWFAAAVVWALVAAARKPLRGRAVLVLLGLAGLLRPDAWLFAGAYGLYLLASSSDGRRVETIALVVAPPLLWLGFDAAITGDPFYSLTHTQSAAEVLDRPTGLGRVPHAVADSVREMLRLPVAVAAALGAAIAIWSRRPRVHPLLAVIVIGTGAFAALGVVGLPLNERYLFDVTALAAILAGYFAFGWVDGAHGRVRVAWAAAAALLLVAVAVRAPTRIDEIRNERADLGARARVANDLRAAVREPAAAAALRACSAVEVFDVRPVPYLAYLLGRPVRDLSFFRRSKPSPRAVLLVPERFVTETFPKDPAVVADGGYTAPQQYRKVSGNRTWSFYAPSACT